MPEAEQIYKKYADDKTPVGIYYPRYPAHARDSRYVKMKMRMGHEGVGIFDELTDFLSEQEDYTAGIDAIPEIAFSLHTDPAKLSALISDFDLFIIENGIFFSPWLSTAMRPLDEKRRKQSEAGKKGNAKRWGLDESVPDQEAIGSVSGSDQEAIASRVEKNREEESKKKESREEVLRDFEIFWNIYDKKTDRAKAEKIWATLTDDERAKAKGKAGEYAASTPDKKFRKDPATYLRNKSFENEIIISHGTESGIQPTRGSNKNAGAIELLERFKRNLSVREQAIRDF